MFDKIKERPGADWENEIKSSTWFEQSEQIKQIAILRSLISQQEKVNKDVLNVEAHMKLADRPVDKPSVLK